MDLELELVRPGRKTQPVAAEMVRELTGADIALLGEERGTPAKPIKRLRDRHHALARMLASGMKDGHAALAVGYEPSRVSILKGDPAFQDLLAFYREHIDAQLIEYHERIAGLSVDAVEELRVRLEESPEEFSSNLLLEIAMKTADRTGYGPSSSSTNVNVNVDLAGRLERARKRVELRECAGREHPAIVDVTPVDERGSKESK